MFVLGEKPYACEICGRRFTQKQNMTSHLTTHRKPKADKSFRAQFSQSELDDFETNAATAILDTENYTKAYRAIEQQSKQLNIGTGQYVLGDMQNIEVTSGIDQDSQNIGLENGLGLLSSVARKGGDNGTEVQVDGIVNIPESQLAGANQNQNVNLDQVVEVLIQGTGETDKTGNLLTTLQLANGSQSKIILDSNVQGVLANNTGQDGSVDNNTAAGLANILQNPDILAAINSAATNNKFIVIGPVSMFDSSNPSQVLSTASLSVGDTVIAAQTNTTFTQDQIGQLSSIIPPVQLPQSQVSTQTVNDSISATTALAAVESYLQGEQPSSSLSKGDEVVSNILGSIQPDGKQGPCAIVQSVKNPKPNNLTINMPPMRNHTMSNPSNIPSGRPDSTSLPMKPLTIQPPLAVNLPSEVSSSIDRVSTEEVSSEQDPINSEQMEAESTTQSDELNLGDNNEEPLAETTGLADSSSGIILNTDGEEPSIDDPILMLSTDENGQPQIIVRMPDGTETIMSDPALAQSLIQVPTISNNDESDVSQTDDSVQCISIDDIPVELQQPIPDQGIPISVQVPSQSNISQSPTPNAAEENLSQSNAESSDQQNFEEPSQSTNTENVLVSNVQLPPEGSNSPSQSTNVEGHINSNVDPSNQGIFESPSQSLIVDSLINPDLQVVGQGNEQLPTQSMVAKNLFSSSTSSSARTAEFNTELPSQSSAPHLPSSSHELPSQSTNIEQFVSSEIQPSVQTDLDSIRAIPDQSLGSVRDSSGNEADSSESIDSSDNITSSDTLTFRSCHNTSDQIPDSSSSNSKSTENTIDSQQTDYPRDQVSTSDEPLIGNVTESENSQADSQTSEIYQNVDNSENAVDSSSNTNISEFHQEIQPDDICQSSTSQVGNAVEIVSLSDSERVSSTESTVN